MIKQECSILNWLLAALDSQTWTCNYELAVYCSND